MTITQERQKFVLRACGHRVPVGRAKCPFCVPPRLDAAPLAAALRTRSNRIGVERMSIEIATRLGMTFERVERHVRRILAGDVRKVAFHTADNYCVALGGVMPSSLWGKEWDDACPVEPYGDEEFD